MREKSLALLVAGGLAAALFTSSALASPDQDCDPDAAPHHVAHHHVHHAHVHHAASTHLIAHAHAKLHRHRAHASAPRALPAKVAVRCPSAAPGSTDCPCANPQAAAQAKNAPDFTWRPGEWERLQ